ncbi:MAG: 16S rRNA (cytosine967-C5)-methyltransferase [Sulfitobacter sp.]|jgi:16S rRNA (cytosine967-C5)-methyltransferase
MTPGARVAAAIEVLEDMTEGLAAEQALTRWARRSRFAGSKDRAAIRDHVFDVMRQRRSAAHFGQSDDPRALMIGLLHLQGADLDVLFNGEGHAPAALSEAENAFPEPPTDKATRWNLPDWILPEFERSLGDAAEATAQALQSRAPVFLRANLLKMERATVQKSLQGEGIETVENPLAETSLTVLEGARKIRNSNAFLQGNVELQDAASQAVVAALPKGGKVLDYCAGGGGKALALAMDKTRRIFAHDIDPRRMGDLPVRADRADAKITQISTEQISTHAPYEVVLCDVPCSGSGAWRRAAEGRWSLTPEQVQNLNQTQDQILDKAAQLVAAGGVLAYATCSVFACENEDRISAFLSRHPRWSCSFSKRFGVTSEGDGFFTAHLTHASY